MSLQTPPPYGHVPDRQEIVVRVVCGALLGLLLAGLLCFAIPPHLASLGWLACLGLPLVGAGCAWRYGDAFWREMLALLRDN